MIGLADCNNFFVSCERSQNTSLMGKAVVVLSNNDGCVIARSNESKLLGIKMGQPAFEIKDMIKEGKVIALSGNHLLYRRISLQVHDIFRRFAPSTLDYSVDEAFLLMNGIPENELKEIGISIYETCFKEVNIPVTIGFSKTKTLAKIVTEKCKKSKEPVGVITEDKSIYALLQTLPISELWGIGRRLAKRLYQSGIHTISNYYDCDKSWVRSQYGVNGERTWNELHGVSCVELEHIDRSLQDSISETRTFPEDIDDYDYLRTRLCKYATECALRLRKMRGKCRRITVFLRGNPFKSASYKDANVETSVMIDPPTDDSVVLAKSAEMLLRYIFNPHLSYKRGGVIISDIVHSESVAPTLFSFTDDEKIYSISSENHVERKKLLQAIDNINLIPGSPTIKLASVLTNGHPGHNDGYSSSFQAPKK